MARGRGATMEIDMGAEPATPPEEAGGEASASLFDASGDSRVRILRRDEQSQKFVSHGFFPPNVTEEEVAMQLGGGYYRAQLVISDGSGLQKIKQQREFKMPGAYKPPQKILAFGDVGREPEAATQAGQVATLPSAGSGDLMEVLKAGIINTLLDMMKASKETRVAPAADPVMLEIMKAQAASQQQMMQLMVTIITPLLTRDAGDNKKDILDTLTKMKELVASPAAAADPMGMFNKMLETFTRMRDVAEDISPPRREGSGDPLTDALPQLVTVVTEQHQMQKARAAAMATRAVPGPAGGVAQMPVVGTITPQQQENLAMWQRILRTHGERMVASAVAKHDPDVLAGTAIIFATPAIREALAVFFHRDPAAVEADILAEVPPMAEHREWLAEFIEAAQVRLFPDEFSDEGEDDAEEPADGRAS